MDKQKIFPLLAAVASILVFVLGNTFFTVNEREKVLVLQFGEAKAFHEEPGLKMKIPFMQTLVRYDGRLLRHDLPELEVTAGDQKRVVVDLYLRYRIKDTLLFYRKVFDNQGVQVRLTTIVDASMRRVIGGVPLVDMLSKKRATTMKAILDSVSADASDLGIEVVDVRIINFGLPEENREAIFQRMESERRQEAKQFRAEGDQKAQEIIAEAEREKVTIIARAERDAEIMRGEGDAQSVKIYADAYNKNTEFFEFYRSLGAYEDAFKGDTSFVLSREDSFFKYLNRPAN